MWVGLVAERPLGWKCSSVSLGDRWTALFFPPQRGWRRGGVSGATARAEEVAVVSLLGTRRSGAIKWGVRQQSVQGERTRSCDEAKQKKSTARDTIK